MVILNILKTFHGFVDESDVNTFRGLTHLRQVLKLKLTSALYWVPHVRT